MLKVFRVSNDSYLIVEDMGPGRPPKTRAGNLTNAALTLAEDFDLEWSEVEEGLVQLQLNDADVAHFGVKGRFMFTERFRKNQ